MRSSRLRGNHNNQRHSRDRRMHRLGAQGGGDEAEAEAGVERHQQPLARAGTNRGHVRPQAHQAHRRQTLERPQRRQARQGGWMRSGGKSRTSRHQRRSKDLGQRAEKQSCRLVCRALETRRKQ